MDAICKQDSNSLSFTNSDWQKIETTLKNLPKGNSPELDIHISKKEGNELEIRLEQPEPALSAKEVKTPIHIKPGLYDLFW